MYVVFSTLNCNSTTRLQRPMWSVSAALLVLITSLIVQSRWFTTVTRAGGEDIVVTSTADPGDGTCDSSCTLRDALLAVEGGETTIAFALSTPATISLSAPLVFSTNFESDISLVGPGLDQLTIDGGNLHRPFRIDNSSIINVTISGMTIANGRADNGGGIYSTRPLSLVDIRLTGNSATGNGGAIYQTSSMLNLTDATIEGNGAAGSGGGLYSDAPVTLDTASVMGNTATEKGGGIYSSDATLSLTKVAVGGNSAEGDGGGIYHLNGTFNMVDSSINNNVAANGGGIFNAGATIEVVNSTISGNSSTVDGGGINNNFGTETAPSRVFLASTTIANNHADGDGGGIFNGGDIAEYVSKNTIIAGNSDTDGSAPDCQDFATSPAFAFEHTLIGDESGCDGLFIGTGNIVGTAAGPVDARLGTLFDNGGSTQTHSLLVFGPASPARDAGDDVSGCTDWSDVPLTTDQRGAPRTQAGTSGAAARCDMGAYESGLDNVTWTNAQTLILGGSPTEPSATTSQAIDQLSQSRWYKFSVLPGSTVQVKLSNLPANYDVTLYKDIDAIYQELATPQTPTDLVELTAEFAPDSFSPDSFSPDSFSPDSFSPDSFSPDSFSPDSFSPDIFAPDSFSPDSFSPDSFSPDSFSPDSFSPDSFSPDSFSPDSFSPDSFSPVLAYASAQLRSLIGASAFDGTADEAITVDTWDNSGNFYVRVRGRNGAFDPVSPFDLEITQFIGTCEGVDVTPTPSTLTATAGNYSTLILSDFGRFEQSDPLLATLQSRLQDFGDPNIYPEINGVVVDVGTDPVIAAVNSQADTFTTCPAAKNLVALTIKDIVRKYRQQNPDLQYVVLIGNDNVIPFFRLPDRALLANEKNYVPPVDEATTSYANLILGYILTQDPYGSTVDLSLSNTTLPIPDLAVGRLVETPSDIIAMLDAYDATVAAGTPGVVPQPQSSLVTGYDFLEDAAQAVQSELEAGIGAAADSLITPSHLSPLSDDPLVWTADDLRNLLFAERHDVMFLAGHFSAFSALAADYETRLLASEVTNSTLDFQNALVFSPGCHSGYNIVNEHGIPNVTREPDWTQAFAKQGATLIAGTGYQYGDTEILEYSEQIYLNFSRQLRVGTGPVAIGEALVAAKVSYLSELASLRGIHEKAVLGTTLYGLPMLSIDMPAGRNVPPDPPKLVNAVNNSTEPGLTLGLQFADVVMSFSLTPSTVALQSATDGSTVIATYLSGADGAVSNPAEPILPLEIRDAGFAGTVLRGVGFRSGSYADTTGITPLTGAATTEIRGVHPPFLSQVFYPVQPWRVNYFAALSGATDGLTRLNITPAQFVSDGPTSTTGILREWSNMGLRLYYSNNITTYAQGSIPALAAPPSISKVLAESNGDGVDFQMTVTGDPAAGIQEVWVTYTTCTSAGCNGAWQSLDLTQDSLDTTRWTGTLALNGTSAGDILYIVQAVNGVGLVSLNTNGGAYFVPDVDPADPTAGGTAATEPAATTLLFVSPPSGGPYGTEVTFSAELKSEGAPLANQLVRFALGSQRKSGTTDANGQVSVTIPLLTKPGNTNARVTFAGNTNYKASSATSAFTISKQNTHLMLAPAAAVVQPGATTTMLATLTEPDGSRLPEKSVFFIVSGNGSSYAVSVITNFVGEAQLGSVPLPAGATYSVDAYFSGSIPLPSGTLTLNDTNYEPWSTSGTLTIEATQNSAPTAAADEYETDEDIPLTVAAPGVLENDTDADGDPLSAQLVSGPGNGTLTLNADGSFTYTPVDDFNGSDSFTYTAGDGALSDAAVVNITINSINDAPLAIDDESSTASSQPVTVDVLANDSDVEGDPITVIAIGDPLNGTAVLNPDQTITYTPLGSFTGIDSFSYTIADDQGASADGIVLITVESPPPVVCSLYPIGLHQDTLSDVAPGTEISDILNGDQPGNFGWLTWSGNSNVPTLVNNLTPPGNSDTYVNPNDPSDHVVSAGDWVQGRPGVSNAKEVRNALEQLLTIDIVVPVWDTTEGQGNNSNYHVVDFAQVRLTDYQLSGDNRISVVFVNSVKCVDSVQGSSQRRARGHVLHLPLVMR